MLKSNPSYLGIAGKNPALGPPKSALGLRPWADFGGPRAGFFPEFLGQGLDFLPKAHSHKKINIVKVTFGTCLLSVNSAAEDAGRLRREGEDCSSGTAIRPLIAEVDRSSLIPEVA